MSQNLGTLQPGGVVGWSDCAGKLPVPGVLLIWIIVGQGTTALAVGAGGGCLDIFSLIYHFSFLSPSVWETARYRLKYCLKGPLSPKTTNQQPYSLIIMCSSIRRPKKHWFSIWDRWKINGFRCPNTLGQGCHGQGKISGKWNFSRSGKSQGILWMAREI